MNRIFIKIKGKIDNLFITVLHLCIENREAPGKCFKFHVSCDYQETKMVIKKAIIKMDVVLPTNFVNLSLGILLKPIFCAQLSSLNIPKPFR